jgi:hypothetical protein
MYRPVHRPRFPVTQMRPIPASSVARGRLVVGMNAQREARARIRGIAGSHEIWEKLEQRKNSEMQQYAPF